ncbi:MAG: signal recognition particle-docking protein FtsY [Actinobacteria bacterium]|nr:signal recognition particle-docking protein FtsY [Actinomycetota bacterium]
MGIFTKFLSKIKGASSLSNSDWEELYSELLESDIGPTLSRQLIDEARKSKSDSPEEGLHQILLAHLSTQSREIRRAESGPTTILVVGVNGTGKTTSVAKLAAYLQGQKSNVVLAAADTFRAAAVDQLRTWGDRLGIEVISGKDNGDPASVAFDSAQVALGQKADFLIIDTAGRLHNKNDLMAELGKVKRVVEKVLPINEVLLVIDATTGHNGISQARIFTESIGVTGIILTKLDGSARGGVALAIEAELGIPIKWVGTGESEGDFAPFDRESYLRGLTQM